MLYSDWLKGHKKEIRILLALSLALLVCLLISSGSRNRFLVKDGKEIVAIVRENPEQTLSLPLEVEAEKDGKKLTYEVILSLKEPVEENVTEDSTTEKVEQQGILLEDAIMAIVDEIEENRELKISLPKRLEDGTLLHWKGQRDFRFLLIFLLLPICLLYIYQTERQQEKEKRKRYEEEIRRALPAFTDQLLLLLNCGMIFHDAFYRIEENYAERSSQDAFCCLLHRIRKEADETGLMVITVMKNLSQEVGVREYVRMVNIMMDHQHRGVNLADKLQAESRLLWEGRKADFLQKGKEMETKMTFPLALLLGVLIIIAGTPALMNL